MTTRVLVVDDDADVRRLLRVMLEAEGYAVAEAPGGAAALDILRDSPDRLVVLLDHLMPGLTGADVLERAAAEGGRLAAHGYILISADDNRAALDLVADLTSLSVTILTKPINRAPLARLVRHAAETVGAVAGDGGHSQ
jgi:CheY-like chemotaxis protein